MKLSEVKADLAKKADTIRKMKLKRKEKTNYSGYVPGLDALRLETRYLHTAYCMAQGTPYEVIEPSVAEGNELSEDYLAGLISKIEMPVREEVENA